MRRNAGPFSPLVELAFISNPLGDTVDQVPNEDHVGGTHSSRQKHAVCCILVNWNGWQDTADCLRSLQAQNFPHLHIIVVDNASTDGSPALIREHFPDIELVDAGENLGFPRGCNVGVRAAMDRSFDFFWLLNNDTVCPPDTLSKLVATANSQPSAGVIATVLRYADNPAVVQAWGGGHVLVPLAYSTHFTSPHVFGRGDYATFASVLIRREVFQQIGLLYEGSFMYYEDSDFCLRAHSAGWTIAVATDTAVLHKEGASMPGTERSEKVRIITAAGLRFIRRHSRWAPLTIPLFLALRLGKRVLHGQFSAARAVLEGVTDYLRRPSSFLSNPTDFASSGEPSTSGAHLTPRK